MDVLKPETILHDFPRPLAWVFSELERAREPVSKFSLLFDLADETLLYITLVSAARYLELRDTRPDADIDAHLRSLQRPSMGDWVACLQRLDRYFEECDERPLGVRMSADVDAPGMLDATARFEGSGRRRVSIANFLRSLVTLRNRTRGHGGISEATAGEHAPVLRTGLLDLLAQVSVLRTHQPVFVRRIEMKKKKFFVEIERLVGTGRPPTRTLEVSDLGALEDERIFLWDEGESSPVLLTPLFAYADETLLLWKGVQKGVPVYGTKQRGERLHQPSDLRENFESRASFILAAGEPVVTHTRAGNARDTYAQAVAQAVRDGRVTDDEAQLLEVVRKALGLSEREVEEVHDEFGVRELRGEPSEEAGAFPVQPDPPARPSLPPVVAPAATPSAAPSSPGIRAAPEATERNAAARAAASALDAKDDIAGAIAAYRRILDDDRDDVRSRYDLARLLLDTARYGEAEALCREGVERGDHPLHRAVLTHIALDVGTLHEAFQHAEQAVALDDSCPEAHLALAACFEQEGRAEMQVHHTRRALDVAPIHAEAMAAHAKSLRDDHDPVVVKELLDRAVRLAPHSRFVRQHRVATFLELKSTSFAVECDHLLARNPRSPHTRMLRAWSEVPESEVKQIVAEILTDVPGFWQAMLNHVLLLIAASNLNDARVELKKLMARGETSHLWTVWDFILNEQGRVDESIAGARRRHVMSGATSESSWALVNQLREAGKLTDAIDLARASILTFPKSRSLKVELAKCLVADGQFKEALSILDSLPTMQRDFATLAEAYLGLGDWLKAEENARAAIAETDTNLMAWSIVIAVDGLRRKTDALRKDLARHPQPAGPWTRLIAAEAFLECGEHLEAERHLEALSEGNVEWNRACAVASAVNRSDLFDRFAVLAVDRNPASPVAHFNHAESFERAGNLTEALLATERALKLDPDNALYWNGAARLLHMLGRPGDARRHFLRAAELTPEDARIVLNVARLDLELGNPEQARSRAGEVLARVVAELVGLRQSRGSREAIAQAEATVEAYHSEWSDALGRFGFVEESLPTLSAGLAAYPDSVTLRLAMSRLHASHGNPADARRVLEEAIRLAPKEPEVMFAMGNHLWERGQRRQALDWFRRVAEAVPESWTYQMWYGIRLVGVGDLDRANALFEGWLTAHERPEDIEEIVGAWLHSYVEAAQWQRGLTLSFALAERHPESGTVTGHQGRFLHELGRYEEALPFLEKRYRERTGKGVFYARCLMALGRFSEALAALERSVEAEESILDYRAMFDCLLALGDFDWARDVLENQILRLDPRATDAAALRAELAQRETAARHMN
jgi:tetratricopeptide (TPR) repeat protein